MTDIALAPQRRAYRELQSTSIILALGIMELTTGRKT